MCGLLAALLSTSGPLPPFFFNETSAPRGALVKCLPGHGNGESRPTSPDTGWVGRRPGPPAEENRLEDGERVEAPNVGRRELAVHELARAPLYRRPPHEQR